MLHFFGLNHHDAALAYQEIAKITKTIKQDKVEKIIGLTSFSTWIGRAVQITGISLTCLGISALIHPVTVPVGAYLFFQGRKISKEATHLKALLTNASALRTLLQQWHQLSQDPRYLHVDGMFIDRKTNLPFPVCDGYFGKSFVGRTVSKIHDFFFEAEKLLF